ncbi:uncharacterized protein SCHCODRAFT_02717648 [Schizophyllum commune H4-8]|uniref:uncharacterized protein n=1 Tax=Schizophyllum commune (strain H4-8 / FGSC 9210) TaxID=578458 RepID=UPI0021605E08|nr:uncharacterized protein SCHCODRAFT_02717648 [Schizophyllum commune H4-8]KAI5886098.1 hypothetical protein SCHCODRAFT_02717648 [Schizophyllum commune H4-8]
MEADNVRELWKSMEGGKTLEDPISTPFPSLPFRTPCTLAPMPPPFRTGMARTTCIHREHMLLKTCDSIPYQRSPPATEKPGSLARNLRTRYRCLVALRPHRWSPMTLVVRAPFSPWRA